MSPHVPDVLHNLQAAIITTSPMAAFDSFSPSADAETTIIAVTFDGGVVLAADSRTSTGRYVANRVSDKISSVHDSIYCCRSGSAADTQAVADHVRKFLAEHALEKGSPPRVRVAANIFRKICYENKDRLLAGIICAGWDPVDGGQVYSIPLGGSLVRQDFSVGGSGSTFIYGLLDKTYRPDMSREECIEFVREAVSHAIARDGSSGGVIRTVIIDRDGVERGFLPYDKLPYHLEGESA